MQKRLNLFVMISLLTLLTFTAAFSEADKTAANAYKAGRHQEAFLLWLDLAKQGDPDAQFNVAFLLEAGQGTKRNLSSALKWYELAARQNYPGATVKLGQIRKQLDELNKKQLNRWLSKAENGDSESQLAVSELYRAGEIVPADKVEAMKWLTLSQETARNKSLKARIRRATSLLAKQLSNIEKQEALKRVVLWKQLRVPIE
ncbi:tetratricopeptide repeat protein [Sneathiella aquimaris]|uniref:tetratricopeptide repeat protein n=1 Tax=Sneathiella aquimaris TaxID=2599305 RepID=UPI00146F8819|nr:tetratricopeptide repeat protein [Sneathiella aquimaris]